MTHRLATIIDPDPNRKKILSLLVRAATPVKVEKYSSLNEASASLHIRKPELIICPWRDGGEQLVTERVGGGANETDAHLIILTESIPSNRIVLARHAGRTELIPSDPLNLNALRNRILLVLEGPATLAARLSRTNAGFHLALESLPALRRRLAA